MKRFAVVVLLLMALGVAAIMEAQVGPVFEAATIKLFERPVNRTSPMIIGGDCHGVDKVYEPDELAPPPMGRCVFTRVSLRTLLRIAYKGPVDGGPAWAQTDYYNVEAKAENTANTTQEQLLKMLQNFIISTFKVELHKEERQVKSFELHLGKADPRIKTSTSAPEAPPRVMFGPGSTGGTAKVTAQNVTIAYFAGLIAGNAGGTVTDKTGITGKYDFSFEWPGNDPGAFLGELQAELGLRVETTKTSATYLIIDKAEKPAF